MDERLYEELTDRIDIVVDDESDPEAEEDRTLARSLRAKINTLVREEAVLLSVEERRLLQGFLDDFEDDPALFRQLRRGIHQLMVDVGMAHECAQTTALEWNSRSNRMRSVANWDFRLNSKFYKAVRP